MSAKSLGVKAGQTDRHRQTLDLQDWWCSEASGGARNPSSEHFVEEIMKYTIEL